MADISLTCVWLGGREALKYLLIGFVLKGFLEPGRAGTGHCPAGRQRRGHALSFRFFCHSLWVSLVLSILIAARFPGSAMVFANLIHSSFALFFILSGCLLLNTDAPKTLTSSVTSTIIMPAAVSILTLIYVVPDTIGLLSVIRDISIIKISGWMPYGSALLGFIVCLPMVWMGLRTIRFQRTVDWMDAPQLILFLAMVKLFLGGFKGYAELSLLASVQTGIMKFSHDFMHQLLVMLMVPDHPLLKTTAWNFIGVFFGPTVATILSLFVLLALPVFFIHNLFTRPLPAFENPAGMTPADRRLVKYRLVAGRRKKSIVVAAYILFIVFAWFFRTDEPVAATYEPPARPLVIDHGYVMIPLHDPTLPLRNGQLFKFSVQVNTDQIKIIVIARPGGELAPGPAGLAPGTTGFAVCLDACEICPPRGYGQRADHVVCIYCNTPIPITTLGNAGGCNPIPLTTDMRNNFISIAVSELENKYAFVKQKLGAP